MSADGAGYAVTWTGDTHVFARFESVDSTGDPFERYEQFYQDMLELLSPPATGDLNRDGVIDVADIDLVCAAIGSQDTAGDLNQDGAVNSADQLYLVEQVLQTAVGDVNLDRRFDSSDLVQVFQAGEYEDDVAGNSTWAEGDWNCDGEFNSSDLILAFQQGAYSTGETLARAIDGLFAQSDRNRFGS